MFIAIDTSTEIASLALADSGQIIAEMAWHCRQNHSVQLLPNLEHLLKQTGLKIEAAGGIIVARGPGSYNGLRVGVSTAKGFAYSLGIPIVGISTMEADAWQHADTGLPVCPIYNAGREEVGTATYQKIRGMWRQTADVRLTTVEALCSEITVKTLFCGESLPAAADKIRKALKIKAVIVSPVAMLRRAAFLAELGMKRLEAGDSDDVTTLQPFYFRGPPITPPKTK